MISASLVKELREKTGAGMMDCKKALVETTGDFEAAVDWLRAKGLANAAKKAGRIAAEGLACVTTSDLIGAVVEVNSETDFVALNEQFQHLVRTIGSLAIKSDDMDSLRNAITPNGKSVTDELVENIATIGENISLRRMDKISVKDGVIGSYVHNAVSDNLGKIAVIVGLESTGDKAKLKILGKQIAMHIAATNPQALVQADLDQALVQRERDIFFEQSRASGKPDNIIEKMIDGRIRKFFEEVVLLEQIFVIDGKLKISEVLENFAKELGAPVRITHFVRYEVGAGIEQSEKNFADEVAALV